MQSLRKSMDEQGRGARPRDHIVEWLRRGSSGQVAWVRDPILLPVSLGTPESPEPQSSVCKVGIIIAPTWGKCYKK